MRAKRILSDPTIRVVENLIVPASNTVLKLNEILVCVLEENSAKCAMRMEE
jgi:hypothetical protein